MPLLDHFRPPLSDQRHWHSFHNAWATFIASQLNEQLPAGYFAEPNVQFGIEIDVAAFEGSEDSPGAIAGAAGWRPSEPAQTIAMPLITDIVEITIYRTEGGPTLAGAVELVSPANKDRPEHRRAFVSKCATFLQQGIGLVMVDVVTARRANLHGELLSLLDAVESSEAKSELYSSAYRPVLREGETQLDVWHEPLSIEQPLPTLPLWLLGGICLPVQLDATYERTCREQRITAL